MKKDCFITAWCFSLAFISSRLHSPPSEGKEESASGTSTASWRSSSPPFPPAVTWSCTSQGCLPRQTGFIFTGMDVKLLYTSLSLIAAVLPQSQCSSRGKAERCLQPLKGTSRISRLTGAVPVEEAFPGLSSGVRDLLCSSPLDAALRLLPLIPPRAGPSPKGDSCSPVLQARVKGYDGTLPALWLPEIPRKSLLQHIVFSNRNSSVLVAAVYLGRIPWDKAFAFFYDELLFSRG